ncbi:MAG: hypothetical protein KDB14_13615 [Planctomycetales bacterium]|nr:hypothetical protein [Planctomycetales bacterium]
MNSDPYSPSPESPPGKPDPGDGEELAPSVILDRLLLALAVWGLLLGLGAMMFGAGEKGIEFHIRPLRGLIVWACMGGFIGFWWLLLRRSANRS